MKSATPSHNTPHLVQNAEMNSKAKPGPDQEEPMSQMLVNELKNLSLVSNPNQRVSHSQSQAPSDNQSIDTMERDKENIPPNVMQKKFKMSQSPAKSPVKPI